MGLTWEHLGRYVAALVGCAVLGWFGFVGGGRVPLLGFVDLGFHELGHMLFMWAPAKLMFLAGSGTQVAVPLGLAVYFLVARRDVVAGSLMMAWTGTSLKDVSVYIADAPYERLPLVFPGATHDWAWLLGPEGFDAIEATGTIAATVAVVGGISVLGAMGAVLVAAFAAQHSLAAAMTRRRWFGPKAGRRPLSVRPARPVSARLPTHQVPLTPHPHPLPETQR